MDRRPAFSPASWSPPSYAESVLMQARQRGIYLSGPTTNQRG
jgi:hypothetical protein